VLFEDPEFSTRLTPVLMQYPLSQHMLNVVYVNRRYVPLKIRAFRDFIVERIANVPEPKPLPLAITQ
jgi:DNA-binding transcriptional LysR family regulator